MPKVSVIVPVYNVERYLARCLDSLIAQTLEDIEIICINDGSTDGSVDILTEYSKKDNRINVLSQVNSGIGVARNKGISSASGEFIGFVDSDDFLDKDFYEKLYNAAKSENAEIACSGVIRENRKKSRELVKFDELTVCHCVQEKFDMAKAPEHSYVWNKIYLTSRVKELGLSFIKGLYYEDMPFTADVLTQMGSLVCVPKIRYHYWTNSTSIIKKNKSDKVRADKIFSKNYILKKCSDYGVKLKEKDTLVCKREFYFLGIKLLKVYQYKATKRYYLFGLFPLITCQERV